jgi:adenosylhomocysteine nucleosidase
MIGVVFALKWEAVRLGPATAMAVSGVGRGRAGRAAEELIARHPISALISAGFAGALSPALKVGDLVVDTSVAEWRMAAARHGARLGPVLALEHVVRTAAERARFAATGALAVDTESAAVAGVAARHGLPFANVRAITDTAARDLVLDWDNCPTPDGQFRLLPLLRHAVHVPGGVAEIAQLWYASLLASRSLGQFLRALTSDLGPES